MFQRGSIAYRLFTLLGGLYLLLVATGVVGLLGMRSSNSALQRVYEDRVLALAHIQNASEAWEGVVNVAQQIEIGEIDLPAAATTLDRALATIANEWASYERTRIEEQEARMLAALEPDLARAAAAAERLRALIAARDVIGVAAHRDALDPAVQTLRVGFAGLATRQLEVAGVEYAQAERTYTLLRNTVLLVLLLAALASFFLGWRAVRTIAGPLGEIASVAGRIAAGDLSARVETEGATGEVRELAAAFGLMEANLSEVIGHVQRSAIQVHTSANEIAATARQQQVTANEIASTTAEVGATAKEISATSNELVRTMRDVTGIAEDTASLADSGREGLGRMQESMQDVTDASAAIVTRLAVLNEKAGNIGSVVTTIAKVADQTNLLSLNAAIEAEKAGEYGRGFSVVATEIRRLADQTAGATGDIEQMVKEMQSAVSAGVMGMDKFSEDLRRGVGVVEQVARELTQIIERIQTLTPSFESVGEGMQSQSEGARQISDALSQLTEAAQQTVESLSQSTQTIEQLNDAARGLQQGVAVFTLNRS